MNLGKMHSMRRLCNSAMEPSPKTSVEEAGRLTGTSLKGALDELGISWVVRRRGKVHRPDVNVIENLITTAVCMFTEREKQCSCRWRLMILHERLAMIS